MSDTPSYKVPLERAIAAIEAQDTERAVTLIEEVLAEHPQLPAAIHVLGLAAARLDEPARTIELLTLAHHLDPDCREHADALAIVSAKLGRLADSLYYGKLVQATRPHPVVEGLLPPWFGTFEEAFSNISETRYGALGVEYLSVGNVGQALEMYRKEAEANVKDAAAWRSYARLLLEVGRVYEALLALRTLAENADAGALDEALTASCLARMGRFQDMRAVHDGLIEAERLTPLALSTMIGDMARDPGRPREALAEAERVFAATFPPADEPPAESRVVEVGALKIGLVTCRLNQRGGLDAFWPMLAAYGFPKSAVYVYATDPVEDTVARRVQGAVASWIDASRIDDLTLATIIRNDGIHVLLDLDGHRPGGRAQLFQYRPAPVALRLAGLPESADAQGFDGVLGDAALYPDEADGTPSDGPAVVQVSDGLYRLRVAAPPVAAGEDGEGDGDGGGAVLALAADRASFDDGLVAALDETCRADPDLGLLLFTDRLGGAYGVEEVAAMLDKTAVQGRYSVGDAAALGAMAETGRLALVALGTHAPGLLEAALSRGLPVFAARGRLPADRVTDSVLAALGLDGNLRETDAAAVAVASTCLGDATAYAAARRAVCAAMARAAETDFGAEWGQAFEDAVGSAYARLGRRGLTIDGTDEAAVGEDVP